MASLTEPDVQRFQQLLAKRREELRWLVHDALIESKRNDYIELAGAVHDAGEEAVASLLNEMDLSQLRREVEELGDVEAALERIRDGTFGKCTDCGDAIDRERLAAYPTAKRCIPCQTRRETAKRGGRDATPSL
jgi:RNA polymerase-binding protein DksA